MEQLMADLFDTGVRKNSMTNEFRGTCTRCLAHQGLEDAEDETTVNGGWGEYQQAIGWIRNHFSKAHPDSSLETRLALGMTG